jgi:hypothetical protein
MRQENGKPVVKVWTAEEVAKDAGVSGKTVDKFLFIQKHASEEEMKRLCSREREMQKGKGWRFLTSYGRNINEIYRKIRRELTT